MLIMITNRCFENCPHCMECSNPQGEMMDEKTFYKAVKFAQFIGSRVITVSGGEPTTHADFFKMCKSLNNDFKMPFTVVSNGTWCLNHWGSFNMEGTADEVIEQCKCVGDAKIKIERQIRRMCSDFKNFIGMQIYTNKLFYKDYDLIHGKKSFFDSFGGKVILDESPIRSMRDLGRAKTCETAQKMVDESKYFMSCLNSALVAKQIEFAKYYGATIEDVAHHFCHPMVDFNGDVHLSESWLCPSVGNVTKHQFSTIWENIQNYKPCGQCKGYKKFMESKDQKVILAKELITYQ